ncbi:MBL fold metallo-hydrolase [Pseudalkalibacillus sp. Hm43]|uniref:MBL fold metallo-hydrolase n=1 Tax=Pseudalkalibacillus sp. Hm43 TaxID=3450742 RepID=UPI003F441BA8
MDMIQLSHSCYYFKGPVNIGYVNQNDTGMLIDTGIDQQVMKKIIKTLEKKSFPVTHLFITHAHADHYGGANYLQRNHDVHTIAPQIEEAILQNPILEPLYLLQGNRPLDEMRNKFLEALPMRVDQVVQEGLLKVGSLETEVVLLPGHSIYQLGIRIGDVLYAADAYFGIEQLQKHKIPFLIDADATLATIEKLLSMNGVGMVPGHGEFEEEPMETLISNYDHHVSIIATMYEVLGKYKNGCNFEQFMKDMCTRWEIKTPTLSLWTLYRTALFAYLIKGIEDHKIHYEIRDFNLHFMFASV